ncbi:MAG: hypothetical protein E7613_08230 [Ruminococcaceae bacterium]|nr:hypothetical protein [Oscillospiraceae bacterium]
MMTGNEFGKKSYEYALGAIKASSHPPLTEDELKRLEEADINDFPRLLDEFGWGRGIEGNLHERIEGEFEYATLFIRDISPDISLTDLLLFEEDAGNLKLFLKGQLIGRDVTELATKGGSIPIEILRGSVEAGDYTLISETLDRELEGIEDETDPFVISSKADRAIFMHTLEVAKKRNTAIYEMLLKYGAAKNRISEARMKLMGKDIEGIKELLLPVPYTDITNDTRSENEIIAEAQEMISKAMYDLRSGENFAPIAEYFFAKKNEAKTLRRLLAKCEIESKEA